LAALDAGADDYIAGPFDPAELLARLRAMLRRTSRARMTSKVRIGTSIVDIARRTVTGNGPQGDIALTPTEWQVLEVLIRRPGRLVSTQQLLTEAGMGFRFRP
jgi:two-component system KDP operon response regulator KdpE